MKYLKLFESFVLPEEVKSNCEDILLELKDLGFTTYVSLDGQWVKGAGFGEPKSWIRVVISKLTTYDKMMNDPNYKYEEQSFDIEEVMEYISRMDNYLSQFGFKPSDDVGTRYNIKTDKKRNPNDFSFIGMNSFVNLWYSKDEKSLPRHDFDSPTILSKDFPY